MDVAAIHGGFLQGRARRGRRAAPRRRGRRPRARTAVAGSACATARAIAAANIVNAVRRLGRRASARLAGARPVGLVPEAAHRLHLRCARRARPRAPADGHRLRRELVHQARGRPVPGLAGRRDALAAVRRPARGDRHRHRRRAHRDGDDALDPAHQEQVGGPAELRRRQEPGRRATTPRSRASSGWPARAATASRPARRPAGWPPAWRWATGCRPTSLDLGGHARRHSRRPLHAAVIERSRTSPSPDFPGRRWSLVQDGGTRGIHS